MVEESENKRVIYEVIPTAPSDILRRYYIMSSEKPTAESLKKGHPVDLALYLGSLLTRVSYKSKFLLPLTTTDVNIREIVEPEKQIEVFRAAKKGLIFKKNMRSRQLKEAENEIEKLSDYFLFDFLMKRK
jgi:hypothetical protein